MLEAEIKFERENREGLVAVGTYLVDASKRFGVHFEDVCVPDADIHYCSLTIKSGIDLLSEMTKAETEHFLKEPRKTNERLACQTKIERPGEIVIMTEEKAQEPVPETAEGAKDTSEEYRKAFEEMPLEKKIANLVQLETIALGETVSFIINSPFKIADKVMDVMAEFGFKKEERQKEAARPAEHKADAENGNPKVKTKKTPKSNDSVRSAEPGDSV
jgi:ferredoxin